MTSKSRFVQTGSFALLFTLVAFGCSRGNQNVQAARENSNGRHSSITEADKAFLIEAEQDNIKERNVGRVAVERADDASVKSYAQMLVDDHTKALRDLVKIMEQEGIRQPGDLPEVKHEALSKLNGVSGATFDREFINLMVNDHEKAVSKFRCEQTAAQDESVRQYAKDVLPVLEKHLKKAKELQRQFSAPAKGRT